MQARWRLRWNRDAMVPRALEQACTARGESSRLPGRYSAAFARCVPLWDISSSGMLTGESGEAGSFLIASLRHTGPFAG